MVNRSQCSGHSHQPNLPLPPTGGTQLPATPDDFRPALIPQSAAADHSPPISIGWRWLRRLAASSAGRSEKGFLQFQIWTGSSSSRSEWCEAIKGSHRNRKGMETKASLTCSVLETVMSFVLDRVVLFVPSFMEPKLLY